MINKFKIDDKHYLTYRENEWDTRVFSKKTFEILDIHTDEEHSNQLLNLFIQKLNACKDNLLIVVRINVKNKYLLKTFQEYGFHILEMVYELILNNLEDIKMKKYKRGNEFIEMNEYHLQDVQDIASTVFHFSRYHLDNQLSMDTIKQRNKNYVEYMYSSNTPNLLYYANNKVSSFHFYSIDEKEKTAVFLLVGSRDGKGFLTSMMYYEVLSKLKLKQIKEVKTLVHADNIDSLKLHLNFGFKIANISYGLNKHI